MGACFENNDSKINNFIREKVINKNIKLFSFWDDIHWWDTDGLNCRLNFFNLNNLLFLPYHDSFIKYNEYSSLHNKSVLLKWWAPEYCFDLNTNWHSRNKKILLTGQVGSVYPLRKEISTLKLDNIEVLNHCGYQINNKNKYNHEFFGKYYYEFMSKYIASISGMSYPSSCGSQNIKHTLNYMLKKNFEILGCGCLGFLEENEFLEKYGFVDNEHYISINKENYKDKFKILYEFPIKCKEIAEKGRKFIKENHSTRNRVLEILQTLNKYLT